MTPAGVLPAVWVNGERRDDSGPHISVRDRGFTVADGIFETMRVRNGVVFRLERHLARLESGLAALGIPSPPALRTWVLGAAHASGGAEAGVRLTVTRGPGPGGVAPPADVHPTVVVMLSPMPQFPPFIYTVGLTAQVASGTRNEHAATAGLKTLAYVDAVVALMEAQRAGADEALFLDTAGHCVEATSSNLFVVSGDTLTTPPTSCGVLPGVTREVVLELAARLGLRAEERPLVIDEVAGADEAFLTSSLRGVVPLVRVDGRAIGTGAPGGLTRRVAQAYHDVLARECGA